MYTPFNIYGYKHSVFINVIGGGIRYNPLHDSVRGSPLQAVNITDNRYRDIAYNVVIQCPNSGIIENMNVFFI